MRHDDASLVALGLEPASDSQSDTGSSTKG